MSKYLKFINESKHYDEELIMSSSNVDYPRYKKRYKPGQLFVKHVDIKKSWLGSSIYKITRIDDTGVYGFNFE
jgi:hypothetical protein